MEKFTCDKRNIAISMICKNGDDMEITAENKKYYMDANLIDLTFNTPIYRIFSIDRLLSALQEKKLCLVKPQLWDDPFENFLFNARGVLDDGTPVSFENIRERFYGQCWSLKKECDGLWRNYTFKSCERCSFDKFKKSHGHTPISAKVKTTVGKLMDAFYDETNSFHTVCYFMGKVDYCTMDEIVKYLKNSRNNFKDTSFVSQVFSLLIKRESFSYEEEVRLIFSKPEEDSQLDLSKIKNPWDNSDLFKFSIEPDSLFDEIEIDPWINNEEYKSISSKIKEYYNGNVVKSKLYNHPFFQVNL